MKDEPFPDFLQITPIRRKKVRSQKYLEFCNLECFCAHLLLVLNKANSKKNNQILVDFAKYSVQLLACHLQAVALIARCSQ